MSTTIRPLTFLFAILIAMGLFSSVVASAAKPADHQTGGKSAIAKACAAEKKADKAAFKETYGKNAMRNCIKQVIDNHAGDEAPAPTGIGDGASDPVDPATPIDTKNAAQECKAERALDPAAFQAKYGANKNGKNAFGKCVASKSKDDGPGDYEAA